MPRSFSMKLLLITGVPGTGKTEISDYLRDKHNFTHLDREITNPWPKTLEARIEWVKSQVKSHATSGKSIVISWGFMPGYDDKEIKQIRNLGFSLIWFDGNRPAARQAFIKRNTVSVELLEVQMQKIEALDLIALKPVVFNPFDKDGVFLEKEEIAKVLLQV